MNIVGISAHYHDAACCLLRDGRVVAAASEERFSRVKHDPRLPVSAFRYCLAQAGVGIHQIDCVAFYEQPRQKLSRQLWSGAPRRASRRDESVTWLDTGYAEREIRELLGFEGRVAFFDHHRCHAASAYYFSGFDRAATWTIDGVGEWTTTSYGTASGAELETFEEVLFPHSLGLLYATITAYLGFAVNSDEYKVMGLAPYGKPRFVDALRSLVHVERGGGYRLDLDYFDFLRGPRSFSPALVELLGAPPREPDADISDFHRDVACSLQALLEELLLAKASYLFQRTREENLCLAGGVAHNSAAVGALRRSGPFRRIFVQPAAGDAGCCLGAAALAHIELAGSRPAHAFDHVQLGPEFAADEIACGLHALGVPAEDYGGRQADLLSNVVDRLVAGKVVAWFHGRMEFGPRALGNRSILADPRDPRMRDRLNALVKKREAFRPFAPSVLSEHAREHFDLDGPAPFMTEVCRVISPLELPAVTHVDGSARPQTVDASVLPRFAALLRSFQERTGCPMLVNTSFNVHDEPIVCSPSDALLSFARSGIDSLVLEDSVIDRSALPAPLARLLSFWVSRKATNRAIAHEVYTLV